MKTLLIILVYLIGVAWFLGVVYICIRQIKIACLFKQGHNPFCRICVKCGSHQVQFESNIEWEDGNTWWEEVYPIGNNPECKCHKYAEYHS